ncbi:MAG: ABC transporter permease, partial [Chloroflexota bacterium]
DFNRGKFPDVITTLFLLILYGIMVGGLAQMREIVKERDIYKRERLVNLKILPYILSKVWVAGLLALYQTAIYVGIHYLAFDMPGGLTEMGLIYITLALATMAGMMLGLFASALSPNANTAPLLLILLVLPQIVLGGSLFPIPPALNAVLSSRWAFEALMSITGIGSDIAADVCWSLPEEVRQVMTIEQKEASNCRCMGTRIFEPASCSFPGLGVFYNPMIDKPAPTEPAPLGDPPPEPVVPPRPQEPVDQSDSIAMSEFFNSLKAWEQQVNEIQEQYKSDLAAYQSKADVFKAESIAYQQALAEWQVARASSVEPAERAIDQFNRDFGWTFVDKNDQMAYWKKLGIAWLAQLAIIATLFVGILILQKRKDTV